MASVIRGDDNFDSANVGPSTTSGAVGTYANVVYYGAELSFGDTVAGSSLYPATISKSGDYTYRTGATVAFGSTAVALSGTWRVMASANPGSTRTYYFLALRIS